MTQTEVAITAVVVVMALIVGPLAALRHVSRRQQAAATSPIDLDLQIDALLPVLTQLPLELRARHRQQVRRFLAHKRFIGCDGLSVSDDMRISIAAFACLLTLREASANFQPYAVVRRVLLYPAAFLVPVGESDEFGLVSDEPEERIGESWQGDRVILSWADIEEALAGGETNVVVHEFAHQLDDESAAGEGAPQLKDYSRWSEVMQQEFERLRRHRRPRVLDPYGGESPAEFFGVVVEAFIQRGAELAQHHPQLYELMRDTFGYDTRDWIWPAA